MGTGESLLQLWRNKGKGRVTWPYLGGSAFLGRAGSGGIPRASAGTHAQKAARLLQRRGCPG